MIDLDLTLFNAINIYAKKSKTLDVVAIFFAEYVGYVLLVFLFTFAYRFTQWQVFFIPLFAGFFSRFVVTQAVYVFYQRKRPLEVLTINALLKKPNHPAFPSGHSSFFFAVSFALFLFNVPLAIMFTVTTCLMVLARVFCGVHWPLDILAGACSALVTFLVLIFLQ